MSLASLGSGIVQGFVIALVALGFTLIYRGTRVVNFANGQIMVFGGYLGWIVFVDAGLPFWMAAVAVALGGAVLGLAIQVGVVEPLRRASLLMRIMAILALSLILDGAIAHIFGADARSFPAYASTSALVGGLNWSAMDLWIMGVTTGCVGGLLLMMYRTEFGLLMRASVDNPAGASLVGIQPNRFGRVAWILGAGITALGGILILPKLVLLPSVGISLTFLAFTAVVIGGFGSIGGAILGGLLVGVVQSVVGSAIGSGYEPLVNLGLMLLILTIWPTGLWGEDG
ncbi:branched-chain amino acid ABC transporter permease [Conexibacter sp. CPCC 206217]|uniref:branched-chain amino acid ABC transporter permease n=1 Tax=Conexibacter sp. CPCC 206217 TaxID=3064574 RepID=UPI00271D60F7|nr:branched-chain amino acid ABC transporter permease [Conexibacter sp. CPCC 206217]MDO8211100.1 branched-chain amino acid ABC transporter permease [Conexibacter sp. CPCC 206217]